MAVSPKVFIGFSSQDKGFVRKLFYRLKSQNVDVWDYSQRGDEIPLGTDIPSVLNQKIEESDFFIPVLSRNSTDPSIGLYARHEMEYVLSKGWDRKGRILPLVLKNNPPETWDGLISPLRKIMHLDVDPDDPKQFEETIERISSRLSVSYMPPFAAHGRLPFLEGFQKEIKNQKLEISLFGELMLIVDDFLRHYQQSEYLEALKIIANFILVCYYRIPGYKPYYPLVIKGVCELHLGKFEEAEETFLETIKHPLCDENGHGGLGQVYFRQRRFNEAIWAYEEALKLCPINQNLEIKFNHLAALIESGQEIKDTTFLYEFDETRMTDDERLNFQNMKGIILFRQNKYEAACKLFETMEREAQYNTATVIYHYLSLEKLDGKESGLALLKREAEKFDSLTVNHNLAHAYWHTRRERDAIRVYEEKLLPGQPNSRQFWIEYARMVKRENSEEMRKACRRVLDRQFFSLPKTPQDFFYDGYANYLLGEDQRARYDYERSGDFCSLYYDRIPD